MAGAKGDGVLNANGTISGSDDRQKIQCLLNYLRSETILSESSLTAKIRVGDGSFLVNGSVELSSVSVHGWEIDGTGAILLVNGAASGLTRPGFDLTDCRFGTLRYLQLIGSSTQPPACGIRFGRKADNESAEHMTLVDVGTRGHYVIAGVINVASEQHQSLGGDYANEREGATYGYFADAFNCAQWGPPKAIQA